MKKKLLKKKIIIIIETKNKINQTQMKGKKMKVKNNMDKIINGEGMNHVYRHREKGEGEGGRSVEG